MLAKKKSVGLAAAVLSVSLLLGACGKVGEAVDPGQWGFTAAVSYHAMGGIINQREVRDTRYMPNSLIFKPSGTTNMLVEPTKDSSLLAGWYTEYAAGNGEGNAANSFDPQSRWDFNIDRVQEEMTIYARWVDIARGSYIDASTGEVVFSKNLTASSPLQPLSSAVLSLITPEGYSFGGYYADAELTEEFDFDSYQYVPLMPTDQQLYDQLAEEFPDNFLPYEGGNDEPAPTETASTDEESLDEVEGLSGIDQFLFIRNLGYELQADDEELALIRVRKNEIFEEFVQAYIQNNEQTTVYLNFVSGDTAVVRSANDLKTGSDYGFFDIEGGKTYELANDIDLEGVNFKESPSFTGTIDGQGYTISNLKLTVSTRKSDFATEKVGALFAELNGATIRNITFKDMVIEVNIPNNVDVTVAALAIDAINSTFEDVVIDGLTIVTGRGDDGTSTYIVSDSVYNNDGSNLSGLSGNDIVIDASGSAQVIRTLD